MSSPRLQFEEVQYSFVVNSLTYLSRIRCPVKTEVNTSFAVALYLVCSVHSNGIHGIQFDDQYCSLLRLIMQGVCGSGGSRHTGLTSTLRWV
jgi:hypothetical protein